MTNKSENPREKLYKKILHGRWVKIVSALASVVVFWTVYALILPAITLSNQEPKCSMAEHTHVAECYDAEGNIVCGAEEHVHNLACYSDLNAAIENEEYWAAELPALTGDRNADVIAVAKSQIGYKENDENYKVVDNEQTKGYTRYGHWYGDAIDTYSEKYENGLSDYAYKDWDAMFVSFVLRYAEIYDMGFDSDAGNWAGALGDAAIYVDAAEYVPQMGDLIFFTPSAGEYTRVGIVSGVNRGFFGNEIKSISVIMGDSNNAVEEVKVAVSEYTEGDITFETIHGYGVLTPGYGEQDAPVEPEAVAEPEATVEASVAAEEVAPENAAVVEQGVEEVTETPEVEDISVGLEENSNHLIGQAEENLETVEEISEGEASVALIDAGISEDGSEIAMNWNMTARLPEAMLLAGSIIRIDTSTGKTHAMTVSQVFDWAQAAGVGIDNAAYVDNDNFEVTFIGDNGLLYSWADVQNMDATAVTSFTGIHIKVLNDVELGEDGAVYFDFATTARVADANAGQNYYVSKVTVNGVSGAETYVYTNGEVETVDQNVVLRDAGLEELPAEKTLTAKKNDYTVTMTYGADAKIPDGAKLYVKEIKQGTDEYNQYIEDARAALRISEEDDAELFGRFFDIKIITKDGEFEPKASVNVNIEYKKAIETQDTSNVSAVHFSEDGTETIQVDTVDVSESDDEMSKVKSVEFSAESFSVYGVVYTIDFATIDGGMYSIPGEDSYKLSELLPFIIGKSGEISNAGLELIEGDAVEGALYLTQDEAGEYWINSETAFDDTYLLTVVVDGVKYVVRVTDAGEADLIQVMGPAEVNNQNHFKITSTSSLDNVARDGMADFHMMYDIDKVPQLNALRNTSATRNGRQTYCWYVDTNADTVGSLTTIAGDTSGYLRNASGTHTVGEYEFVGDRVYFYLYKDVQNPGEEVVLNPTTSNLTVNVDFSIQMDADKIKDQDSSTIDFPGTYDPTITYQQYSYKQSTKSLDGVSQNIELVDGDYDSNGQYTIPWKIEMPAQDVDLSTLVFSDSMNNGLEVDKSSVKITYQVPGGSAQTVTVPQNSITGTNSDFSFDARAAMGINPIPAGTTITVTYDSKLSKNQTSGYPGSNAQAWKNNTAKWTINGHDTNIPTSSVQVTYKDTSIKNGTKSGTVLGANGDGVTEASKDANGKYRIKYTLAISEPLAVQELSVMDTPDSRVQIDYSTFQMKVGDSGTAYGISASQGQGNSFTVDIDNNFPSDQKVNGKIPADTKIYITYEATVDPSIVTEPLQILNEANYTVEGNVQDDLTAPVWLKESPEQGSKEMTRSSTQVFDNEIDTYGYFEIPYEASVVTNFSYNSQLEYIDTLSNNHSLKDNSVTVTVGGHTYNVNSNQIIKNGQTFTVDIDSVITSNGGSLPVPAGTEIKVNYITKAKASDVVDQPNAAVSNNSDWKFDNRERPGQDTSHEFTGPLDDHIGKRYTREVDGTDILYTFEVVVGDGTYPLDGHTVTDTALQTLYWVDGFTVTAEEGHAAIDGLIVKTWEDPQYAYQIQNYSTHEVFSLTFPKQGDTNYAGPYYGPYTITYQMKAATNLIEQAGKKSFDVRNTVTHQKKTKKIEFTDKVPSDEVSLEKKFSEWDLDNKLTYWTIELSPPASGTNYEFNLYEDGNSAKWGTSENNINQSCEILWSEATAVYKNDPDEPFTNFTVGSQWSQNNCLTFTEGSLTEPVLVTIPVRLQNLSGGGFDLYVRNTASIYKPLGNNNYEKVDDSTDEAHKENYYPNASVKKTVLESNPTTHETTWQITVNEEHVAYPEGTYITITDIVPEGMTWSENHRYGKPNRLWFIAETQNVGQYQPNDGIEPTTDNVDSVNGGGTFTLDLSTVNGGIGLSKTKIVIEYVTKLVDGEYDNLLNVGEKPYTNKVNVTDTNDLIDNGDEATQIYGYDALEKKEQVGTGLSGGKERLSFDVIDYEIVINSEGKVLNSNNPLTLSDTLPTNVELDVNSIRVYNASGVNVTNNSNIEVGYHDDSRTMTVKIPDGAKYTVKFSVNATDTSPTAQHFVNTCSLQGHGYWEDSWECDHIITNHQGSAIGNEAKLTLYKIDGNNVIQPLEGAKFKFYKCILNEDGRIVGSEPVTDATGNEFIETGSNGLSDWHMPDATGNVNKTVFYFIETEPSDPTYAIGEYAEPHYFIMYSGERGGEGYQAADVIDDKVTEANGVIVNKVSYGYAWKITNRNHMDYTAEKQWKDDEDDPSQRPDYIWLRLLRDGETCPASGNLVNPVKVTPRVNGKWTYMWENLPMVDPTTHHEYEYTVIEDREKKADNDYTDAVLEKLNKYVMTVSDNIITNRKIQEGNLHILKKWDDDNNANYTRPTEITVSIYRYTDDPSFKEFVKTVTLTAGDKWAKDVKNLDVEDSSGDAYTYVVEEAEIDGYVADPGSIIQVDDTWTVEFTNVENSSTEFEATKIWADTDDTKLQSAQVIFNLYREIEGVRDPGFGSEETLTISDKVGEDITTWKKLWPDLPATGTFTYTPDGGEEQTKTGTFTYRVEETKIIYDNKESSISNNVDSENKWIIEQNGDAITNTLNETDFSIKKIWLDSNTDGQKETWPDNETIGVTLYRNATYTNTDNEPCTVPEEIVGTYTIPVNGLPDDNISVTLDSTNTWYVINFAELADKVPASMLTNPSGDVEWTYYVKETTVPDGYSMQYGSTSGAADNSKSSAGEDESIINSIITVTLPETGGIGTSVYRMAGLISIVIALIGIYLSKRRGRWCDGC